MDSIVMNALVEFAKEHAHALVVATGYYFLAGLLGAILGKWSQIDAWCQENPKRALVINFLRGTGFDLRKILTALKTVAEAKSKFVPPGVGALLLVASLGAAGVGSAGCSRTAVDNQIDKALLFEHQVMSQVGYLDSLFGALIEAPGIPPEKQQEFREKFADAKAWLAECMSAKDAALRAAKEANAETVDLNKLVNAIVDAVQRIIGLVATAGASPILVQEQQIKALNLSRGLQ